MSLRVVSPPTLSKSCLAGLVAVMLGWWCSGSHATAESSDFSFSHLSVEHGLSHVTVNCIHQDKQGFMWLGTSDGLNRYDGNEILVFRPEPIEGEAVGGQFSVRTIHEDAEGYLWLGGVNTGVTKFDPSMRKFVERHRFNAQDADGLASTTVFKLSGSVDGKLWIGTDWGGLHRLDPRTGKLEHFALRAPSQQNTNQGVVQAVHPDATDPDTVWLGTAWMGLVRVNAATGEIRRFVDDPPSSHQVSPPSNVTSIVEDSPGVFWVTGAGKSAGLYRFDAAKEQFLEVFHYRDRTPGSPALGLSSVLKDHDGHVWVSSNTKGIARFDSAQGAFEVSRYDASDPKSLSSNQVSSLYQDRGGMIWVAMSDTGLCVFDPRGGWIQEHRFEQADPGRSNPLRPSAMLPDELDPGIVWLGSGDGLSRWDRRTGKIDDYRNDPGDDTSLSNNQIRHLTRRAKGGIWIGTSGGLNRFDPDSNKVVRFEAPTDAAKELTKARVFSLHEDRSGILWIGRQRGARRFDPETNEFEAYFHDPADPSSIGARSVAGIHEDAAGNLWFAHLGNGLSKRSPGTDQFVRIESKAYAPGVQSGLQVFAFHNDIDGGILWVGTNRGLGRIEIDSGELTLFPVEAVVPNVVGIEQEETGPLWIRTTDGILRVADRHSEEPKFQFTTGAVGVKLGAVAGGNCMLVSGEILFTSAAGILEVQADRFRLFDAPPVVLTGFQLLDDPAASPVERLAASKIVLTDDENKVMRFKFAALDFAAPDRNRFAYRLEGLQDEWHYDVDGNSATYTTLKPGDYVFRVKAANSQGVWNEHGASIALTILPPWWATWWFRCLAAAALIVAFVTVIQVRTRSSRRRATELEQGAVKLERLNRELRISDERFHSYIANASEQVWCVELEKPIPLDLPYDAQAEWILDHAHFAEANEALAEAYGATVDEILTWRFERVMPRSLPSSIPLLTEVARSGYRMENFETNEVAKDGSARVMLNNFLGTIRDGKVVRVWGTTRDVTDLRRTEQEIRLRSTAIATMRDGCVIVDAQADDMPIVYVNDRFCEITGYERSELLGRNSRFLQGPETSSATVESIRNAINNQKPFEGELLNYRKDGTSFSNFMRLSPVIKDDGSLTHYVGVLSDVTQRKLDNEIIIDQNSKLLTEIERRRETQEKLHNLTSHLIHTQEHERRHIAQELHDDITQRLTATAMDIKLVENTITESPERASGELQRVQRELNDMAVSTQEISRQLHPKILEELGLSKAISAECRRFGKRSGIQVDTDVSAASNEEPTNDDALCLYRILQESLGNIIKHSKASRVDVTLWASDQGLTLTIVDDGVGFKSKPEPRNGSLGLVSMKERARQRGATLHIESHPGQGTEISVTLPNHPKHDS